MSSEVTICNLALSHLGAATINSLDDLTKEGRACKLHYAAARDFVLRDHPWNFATRREYLALLAEDPPVGWSYAYAYPSDCHQARRIWQETQQLKPTPFEVMRGANGRVIATNEGGAVLEYTAKITDPSQFDAMFINALSYYLATELAMPITKSPQVGQTMMSIYMARVDQAAASDGREGHTTVEAPNSFLQARR